MCEFLRFSLPSLSRTPFCSHCYSSVTQSQFSHSVLSLTLCDPMDCSTPGFPAHHQLPKLAQTHVHQVSDAIQPSHPLSSPSAPVFNLSQLQGLPMSPLFASGGQSIGASASVLPVNIQVWFPLGWTGLISLLSNGLSRVFSNASLKASILRCPALFIVQLTSICDYWKNNSFN